MIGALTSLRFFAAFAVYLHHLNYPGKLGDIAVGFFFMLSGFILTYNYKDKFETISAGSYFQFFGMRLGRVYPLHILTFVLSIPFVFWTSYKWGLSAAIKNIFLVQTYAPSGMNVFSFNGVSWSISDEMFFYTMFPIIIFLLHEFGAFATGRRTVILLTVSYAIPTCLAFLLRHSMQGTNWVWWLLYCFPPIRLFDFVVGICIGALFLRFKGRILFRKYHRLIFTALETGALLVFVGSYHSTYLKYPTVAISAYYMPSFAAILFIFAFQNGLISKLISNKFLIHLGDISFSTYMLHQLIISYVAVLFGYNIYGAEIHNAKHTIAQFVVLILVLALSDVVYRHYETPVRMFARMASKKINWTKASKQITCIETPERSQ